MLQVKRVITKQAEEGLVNIILEQATISKKIKEVSKWKIY